MKKRAGIVVACVAALVCSCAPQAELETQPLRELDDPEREQPHLKSLDVRFRERVEIRVAVGGFQRRLEHRRRRHLEVDEVVLRERVVECDIAAALVAITPAVGLGIEIGELLRRRAEERGHCLWQTTSGRFTGNAMPELAPREQCGGNGENGERRDGQNDSRRTHELGGQKVISGQ